MSLLQFTVIISSVIFIFFALDLYQRKKITILHVVVFVWWTSMIWLFWFYPNLLDKFWSIFGAARWADVLVYIGIISLMYLYFELLNASVKDDYHLTNLISHLAVSQAYERHHSQISSHPLPNNPKDQYIFFIRAYNEYETIKQVIDEVIEDGFSKILIVDDSWREQFNTIIRSKQLEYSNALIIHIKHNINRGRGGGWASLKTGLLFLREYGNLLGVKRVVWYDADAQMDIKDMKTFMSTIHQQEHRKSYPYDVLLGSRFVTWGKAHNIPIMRRIILFGAKFVTYLFNRIWISDSHCWYRVYSLKTAQCINISSDGMVYANELNEELKRLWCHFIELPVHIKYTDYSLGRGQRNSNAVNILIQLLYRKLFFR